MATQQEVIKAFMASLDTTTLQSAEALDEAIRACSTFNSFAEIKATMMNDVDNAMSGDDFLKRFCGIDSSNEDTGAITGLNAGGTTVKTTESIVPEEGDIEIFTGDSFTVGGGLTIQLASLADRYNPVAITYDDLADDTQRYIWWALKKWWASSSLNLIAESYGDNFGFSSSSSATVKKIYFGFFTESGEALASTPYTWNGGSGDTHTIGVRVNMDYYGSLADGGNPDGKTANYGRDGADYLDRCLAHEFMHAVMAANIKHSGYLPAFVKEGIPELTIGIDNWRVSDQKTLASNSALLSQALVMDSLYPDVEGVYNPSYAGGFMFFRYLARQMGDVTISNSDDTLVTTFRGNDNVTNFASNALINSGAGNDYVAVSSSAKKVTISSEGGNDFINNWGEQASINTADGNDTVYNSSVASDAYILTGTGADSINSSGNNATLNSGDGNDTIENYGNDVSIIGGADNDSVSNYGGNVTIETGSGNDTVELDEASNEVIISLGDGNDYANSWSKKTTIDGGEGNDYLHSHSATTSINGGAGSDTIYVNTNAHNNTVNAGLGNDYIVSYNGTGVLYEVGSGDGNDTIDGYNEADTIAFDGGGYYGRSTVNNDVVIDFINGGEMTLLGASGKTINVEGATFLNVIDNTDNGVKLYAAEGEDSIKNYGNKVTVVGASDVDSIWNYGESVSINGNSGDDRLDNRGNKVTVVGGAGNDLIWNDTAQNGANSVKAYGGDGNDALYNFGSEVTMLGGSGSDSIYNYKNGGGGVNVSISGDADNDYILNFGTDSTLNSGAGDDTISNLSRGYINGELVFDDGASNVVIIGGKGNDFITNSGKNVTFQYTTGDGFDTISGFNETSTLEIDKGKGTYSKRESDGNVILTVGKEEIILQDAATLSSVNINGNLKITDSINSPVTIDSSTKSIDASERTTKVKIIGNANDNTITGGSGSNTLYGGNGDDKLIGGASNDSLHGGAGKDTLAGGDGDDYLFGSSGNDSLHGGAGKDTLAGGDGADYLFGGSGNDSLNGGAGNDNLNGGADDDTIKGGKGNDKLWGDAGADTFTYEEGDGKDIIFGFANNDTLTLDYLDFTPSYKNKAVTLTFDDGCSITFKNFTATTFHIDGDTYKINSRNKFVKQ